MKHIHILGIYTKTDRRHYGVTITNTGQDFLIEAGPVAYGDLISDTKTVTSAEEAIELSLRAILGFYGDGSTIHEIKSIIRDYCSCNPDSNAHFMIVTDPSDAPKDSGVFKVIDLTRLSVQGLCNWLN